jgi:biopolymer transport protein ExbD
MAKIRKDTQKEPPAISTASLPDIIFMLLFFFMVSTTMRDMDYKVSFIPPEATEIQKLEKKTRTRYIFVGEPTDAYRAKYGQESRIQLDDAFAEVKDIESYIINERQSMSEEDQPFMTVSIKASRETKMGIITDIKQALRRAYALKISYAATQRTSY